LSLRILRADRHEEGVFRHACKLGLEGIVSKRKAHLSIPPLTPWLKMKNPEALAVKWEAEEDWARW
jgi:ATP-dependent DNA ligase